MEKKCISKPTGVVVSGSVWETRIMNDQIMGGFKVFNEKNPDEEKKQRLLKQSPIVKRKTWKSDSNSVQILAKKSGVCDRNKVQIRNFKDKSCDLDDEKAPIQMVKMRSKECERNPVEISDGVVNGLARSGEAKTESVNVSKSKSVPEGVLDENNKALIESKTENLGVEIGVVEPIEETQKKEVEIEKNASDLGEEKPISSGLINVGIVKSAPELDDLGSNCNKKEDMDENEMKLEKQSIQEIKSSEQKPKQIANEEKKLNHKQLPIISSPVVKKQTPHLANYSRINQSPSKIKTVPEFDRSHSQRNLHRIPQTHGKLQSLIDLVMWKDVSKSAFIFGIGTFTIISSSYTKDLNISLISVFSYLGLVYLASIFIFRSIISRGVLNEDGVSEKYVVGEEDAIWLLKMVLPYLNEFLIKIKALFSGDPATTMKLAVLLFVLARSGSSITIWKLAKLGFFGVFTLPKICSSYSTQLSDYGKFWARRFQDAWESCSHKKAVGFGIFTFVWNLSSVIARIWAVFMLFVAFRYYQQSMVTDDDCVVEEEEEPKCEQSSQGQVGGGRRLRHDPINVVTIRKEKKKF